MQLRQPPAGDSQSESKGPLGQPQLESLLCCFPAGHPASQNPRVLIYKGGGLLLRE